jgi:hypothetical protein
MPGVPGGPRVVIDDDAADAAEVPIAFVAVTVNVYVVLGVSPVIMMVPESAWSTAPVFPPGLEVAVYCVIVEPPLDAGAVKRITAAACPAAAASLIPGAPGIVAPVEEAVEVTVGVEVATSPRTTGPVLSAVPPLHAARTITAPMSIAVIAIH